MREKQKQRKRSQLTGKQRVYIESEKKGERLKVTVRYRKVTNGKVETAKSGN